MKVPFLDLKAQYRTIKDEVLAEINDVLDNTAYVLGKKVHAFEEAFAEVHGARHCYGVSSGTDGNHMVLWALGVGPGDEVIIPDNTFIATAWGATLCGAKPVFVDCHPESYNLDPAKIAASITPKTKAIVAVHLYGQSADIEGIESVLESGDFTKARTGVYVNSKTGQTIYVVEDCAQAHFSEYKGRRVGTLGVASSWSFYPGKNLGAYGEAGAVMTNDDELARKFKMMRDHGSEEKYTHVVFGHNYRMEEIQGAVLGVKLKHLHHWTEGRRRVAEKYRELLWDLSSIKLPMEMKYAKHVYHLFVIQVDGDLVDARKERDALKRFLQEREVGTGLHYPIPLHLQPCFGSLGYGRGDFPVSEELADRGLSLPMYPELTDDQIEYVASSIREFFKSR